MSEDLRVLMHSELFGFDIDGPNRMTVSQSQTGGVRLFTVAT